MTYDWHVKIGISTQKITEPVTLHSVTIYKMHAECNGILQNFWAHHLCFQSIPLTWRTQHETHDSQCFLENSPHSFMCTMTEANGFMTSPLQHKNWILFSMRVWKGVQPEFLKAWLYQTESCRTESMCQRSNILPKRCLQCNIVQDQYKLLWIYSVCCLAIYAIRDLFGTQFVTTQFCLSILQVAVIVTCYTNSRSDLFFWSKSGSLCLCFLLGLILGFWKHAKQLLSCV